MTWSLAYADGSANAYEITPTSLRYTPVTPAQSSTGTYSGGPLRAAELTSAQATQILDAAEALAADSANHVPDRGKGTGAFALTTGAETRLFIVARVPALLAFDAMLAALGR